MEDELKPFIKKLLKRGCITVSSEETIKEVAALLAKNSIGAVPVTNKNEEVIGIVSIGDVVIRLMEKLDGEAEQLRSFINS